MRKFLKWVGISLATIAGALVVFVAVLVFLGGRKLSAARTVEVQPIGPVAEAESIERGAHIARSHCTFCHGDDLAGKAFIEDAGFILLNAPNLTRGQGGVASRYTDDAAWIRSIRHGVNPQGRALIIMPAENFYFLTDRDLRDVIAYVKSLPPVDRTHEAPRPSVVARALLGAGILDGILPVQIIDLRATRLAAVPEGATPDHGKYLVDTVGCRNCHGSQLSGQMVPGNSSLVAPNLTPQGSIHDWSEEDFLTLVEEQESKEMPWSAIRAMSDDEKRAIYRYLTSLPGLPSTTHLRKS